MHKKSAGGGGAPLLAGESVGVLCRVTSLCHKNPRIWKKCFSPECYGRDAKHGVLFATRPLLAGLLDSGSYSIMKGVWR